MKNEIVSLSWHAQKRFFEGEVKSIGHNFRLNEIQSALGLSQLKKAPFLMQKEKKPL